MQGGTGGTPADGRSERGPWYARWWISVPIFLAGVITLLSHFEPELRSQAPALEVAAERPLTVIVEGRWDSVWARERRAPRAPPAVEPEREAAPPQPRREPGAAPGKAYVEYRVKKGDSLWKIAARELGDGGRWTQIAELNPMAAKAPKRLRNGVVLRLPSSASETGTERGRAVRRS